MLPPERPARYAHTQSGPLGLLLIAVAAACFGLAWAVRATPGGLISGGAGLVVLALAPTFSCLTTRDAGDRLIIAFGPLELFRRSVRYAELRAVEVGRTGWLDGWGIHYRPGSGWVWNLWGWDCVVVRFERGELRIGTDDPEGLAAFLQSQIDHRQ